MNPTSGFSFNTNKGENVLREPLEVYTAREELKFFRGDHQQNFQDKLALCGTLKMGRISITRSVGHSNQWDEYQARPVTFLAKFKVTIRETNYLLKW